MEETKRKLYVEPDGFCTEASILFMVLAVIFRLVGSIGRWDDLHYLITMVALPIFSGLLFLLCLLFFSRRAFWTTVIPVVFGVVFFIFRIMGVEDEWQKVGCIALYVVIAVLYAMSFSHPRLKWALALILLGAFAWHVAEDLPGLMDLEHPVSFVDGMQELSILGIILSLLSVSLAMKMPARVEKTPEIPQPAEAPQPETPPAAPALAPEDAKPAEKKHFGRKKREAEKKAQEEKLKAQEIPLPPPVPEEPLPEPIETVILPSPASCAEPVEVYPLDEPEAPAGEASGPAEDGQEST